MAEEPPPSSPPSEDKEELVKELEVEGRRYRYYDVTLLGEDYSRLPYSLRVLVECLVRRGHASGRHAAAWRQSVARLLDFAEHEGEDVLYQPGRVLLQDFTGVPALVDLAAVRDAVLEGGGDVGVVDSLCPADLVVDHTVQLDYSQIAATAGKKGKKETKAPVQQPPPPPQTPQCTQPPPPMPAPVMPGGVPPRPLGRHRPFLEPAPVRRGRSPRSPPRGHR